MSMIPPGFDPVAFAVETAPQLAAEERAELEASTWAKIAEYAERGDEGRITELLRNEAGGHLRTLGERDAEPQEAALRSQALTAQADLVEAFAQLARDPRFDELDANLRSLARALAVRTLVRAIALHLDPGGVLGGSERSE